MIVVSTYNDVGVLDRLLKSLDNTKFLDEKVLVICSCPNQTNTINYLKTLKIENNFSFDFDFSVTPYSGYDTGAYIWAFYNYPDEYYIFLQDSLIVNQQEWLNKFKEHRDLNTLNTWCTFKINDEVSHTSFFFPKMGFIPSTLNGNIGVFGPIFQISRHALNTIDKKFNLQNFIPSNKMEACAMERGWTYLTVYSGFKLNCIDGQHTRNISEYQNKLFTKTFNNRI